MAARATQKPGDTSTGIATQARDSVAAVTRASSYIDANSAKTVGSDGDED